jgi:hypothetical protein
VKVGEGGTVSELATCSVACNPTLHYITYPPTPALHCVCVCNVNEVNSRLSSGDN